MRKKLENIKKEVEQKYDQVKLERDQMEAETDVLSRERVGSQTKAKNKLRSTIKKYSKPPMSARQHLAATEPVIRIYPDYNPKMSRNQMRPVSIKAWETARTMAATPFSNDRQRPVSPDNIEGF